MPSEHPESSSSLLDPPVVTVPLGDFRARSSAYCCVALSCTAAGWLRALSDKCIAPALRLMHREPERAWRLDELAKEVAMSRTSFALRFKKIAGVAPLTYLLNLSMRFAEQGLREGSMSVSALGLSLGYTTESAFSKEFKRTTGMAPKRYQSIFARMDRSTSCKGDRISHSSNLRHTAVRKSSTRGDEA